nr:ribonuclease H-like domain-containing protein [Tanacetum cinerariifolium]
MPHLVAYSDADWIGCPTTRRSTLGYSVFLGNNLLSWSSKYQSTLSHSSAEAEYRGVANVVAESWWLRNLLRELHTPLSSAMLVYCDIVCVLHVPSHYQFVDIFTKGLPSALFEEFRFSLSIRCPPALTARECPPKNHMHGLALPVGGGKGCRLFKEIESDGQHEKKDVKGEIEIARAALIQQEDDLNSEGDAVEGVLGVGGDGSNSLKPVDRLSKSDEVGSDNVVRGFKDIKSLSSKRISVCNIVSDNDLMVAAGNNSKVGKVCVADGMVFDPKKYFESASKGKYAKFKMAVTDCHKVVSDILVDGKSDHVESCDVKKGKSLLSKRRRVYNVVSDDDDTVVDDNKVYVADHVVNDKKKSIKRAIKGKAIDGCDKVFSAVVADADNYVKLVDSTVKCDKVESGDVSYDAKKINLYRLKEEGF